jgi:hypothetical protein
LSLVNNGYKLHLGIRPNTTVMLLINFHRFFLIFLIKILHFFKIYYRIIQSTKSVDNFVDYCVLKP